MKRYIQSKSVELLFICSVMFCAIMVTIPINNVSYIANDFSLGTLMFKPKLDFLSIAQYAFNALMFVPIGVFSYLWFTKVLSYRFNEKNSGYSVPFIALLFCIILSIFFELAQLLLSYRVTDLDDLIMNTLGSLVGILLIQAVCAYTYKPLENQLP